MPTKDRRKFVERAIKMFARQRGALDAELLILEDGNENCSDLAAAAVEELRWIKIRHVRSNGSIGAKLNEGARLARGHFIVRWDDDDFQHYQRLHRIQKHFALTGAQMIGMSSMPYWREGESDVWVYNSGDARYCTGSGQAFRRDWALANPHADSSLGEDEHMARLAASQGVLSTISGTDWVVACTHNSHCSERNSAEEAKLEAIFGRRADNWQKSSIDKFSWVQQWAFQASA